MAKCKECGAEGRLKGYAVCAACLGDPDEEARVQAAAFEAVGLDAHGHLPGGRRLIYTEYADGSHPQSDEGAFRLHVEAARVQDGLVYGRILDCEGYGRDYRILGTFPETAEPGKSPAELAAIRQSYPTDQYGNVLDGGEMD